MLSGVCVCVCVCMCVKDSRYDTFSNSDQLRKKRRPKTERKSRDEEINKVSTYFPPRPSSVFVILNVVGLKTRNVATFRGIKSNK